VCGVPGVNGHALVEDAHEELAEKIIGMSHSERRSATPEALAAWLHAHADPPIVDCCGSGFDIISVRERIKLQTAIVVDLGAEAVQFGTKATAGEIGGRQRSWRHGRRFANIRYSALL
jgi:hypothetical protein